MQSTIYFKISDEDLPNQSLAVVHNKHNRKNRFKLTKNEYEETRVRWSLSKFLRKTVYNPNDCEFIPMSSSDMLSNGLSNNEVLKHLNSDISFDNYIPQDNDYLKIWQEFKHPEMYKKSRPFIENYISFIFKGEWHCNTGFEHIDNVYEDVFEGDVYFSK
jgi:hypothetical protein